MLDDDPEQWDGSGQEHPDRIQNRPSDLDRKVESRQYIGEIDPAVHDADPGGRIRHLDDLVDHRLVAQGDKPQTRRPRHHAVGEQGSADVLAGCGHAVVLFCFGWLSLSALASSAR